MRPWVVSLQYHHGVQLDFCTSGALSPIPHCSNDKCPSVKENELLLPSSLLHRSHLVCFWFVSGPTSESFQISSILGRLLISLWVSSQIETNEYISVLISNVALNCSPFLQYGPHVHSVEILPYAVVWIHWLPTYKLNLPWNHQFCYMSLLADFSCVCCKAQRVLLVFPLSVMHSWLFL